MGAIKIKGHFELFNAIQHDVYRYKIVIFRNGNKENRSFFVSLQPTGKDVGLPEYQLDQNSKLIDQEILDAIPQISVYLKIRNKRDLEELANSCKN
jgi:hypothetical protein